MWTFNGRERRNKRECARNESNFGCRTDAGSHNGQNCSHTFSNRIFVQKTGTCLSISRVSNLDVAFTSAFLLTVDYFMFKSGSPVTSDTSVSCNILRQSKMYIWSTAENEKLLHAANNSRKAFRPSTVLGEELFFSSLSSGERKSNFLKARFTKIFALCLSPLTFRRHSKSPVKQKPVELQICVLPNGLLTEPQVLQEQRAHRDECEQSSSRVSYPKASKFSLPNCCVLGSFARSDKISAGGCTYTETLTFPPRCFDLLMF